MSKKQAQNITQGEVQVEPGVSVDDLIEGSYKLYCDAMKKEQKKELQM